MGEAHDNAVEGDSVFVAMAKACQGVLTEQLGLDAS